MGHHKERERGDILQRAEHDRGDRRQAHLPGRRACRCFFRRDLHAISVSQLAVLPATTGTVAGRAGGHVGSAHRIDERLERWSIGGIVLMAVLLMAELVTRPTFIVIMATAIAVIVPRGLLTPMTLKRRLHAGRHVEIHGAETGASGVRAPPPG